jgi:PAS domain S-box-containing protein
MTTKQVAQILDLLDLPVGVMDRRFRTQILNRAARDFLKRVGITVGDRSKRSRYSESRAFITPVVTETFRSGRVTFAPDFDLGVPIEGGLVIAVCPGRIQTSDVAFIVAVTGSSKRDKDSVLQHIVEGFAPGVVLVGPDMKHRVFSTRARSMFRLGAVNPIGMRTSEMNPSEQAKVLEQQFAKLMQDHTGRIEEAYPVASSKLGVIRSDIIAWPVWTSDGVCEGLMLLMQPVETQATAPYPDAKAIEMLGREGYAYGPPIFYTHVDGTISVMTAAGRALVGEAASDRPASFKTGLKWAHPEVIEAMYGDLVRGSEFATVMTELHTDQGLKPMRILAHAIREVGDITSQIRLVLSDVSEFENTRKMLSETIKSLATQNEVMDKALEALDLPIAVFDSDLKVVKINTAIANRLGISPKDAEGRDIAEVIPTARRLGMADLMRQAMDQWKETHVPRYEHVTRDGHEVPIEGVLFPLRIEGRRCCLAVSREMADVAKLEKESARWASLCRALMGATRDGVVVLDRDGVAVQVNEVIARRFKDKSRLVGRTSADFFMV